MFTAPGNINVFGHEMFDGLGVRQLKHFITCFKDIQYGKALWRNVPTEWLSAFLGKRYNESTWERMDEDETQLIEIETKAT